MTETTATPVPNFFRAPFDPLGLGLASRQFITDAWQRSLLYADVRRQRGNQYQAHLREASPNVLGFGADLVMSGLDLPQPVNYWLVRIAPLGDESADPGKRPFVVIDPRAGHGPGIGGFKPDSEIGAALAAGHPCYFVGFSPDPAPGQTVENVMRAEAAFIRKVAELHPQSIGKPAVIGNCQAGWQIMMTASLWPELFGPIILAGAPLSYWAGNNPMRYAGGLLGGSWLTALTSDLGAGRFDGAGLVQNFENLDPANTLWAKQYNLYANVDTEGPRYLGFEKYWGGYVFLDQTEMQYIVDNLFIGNKLANAQLSTSDGMRIDLRNILSPIVVFCSHGDNITPPAQALGWITDLYRSDEDVASHDQTIVFATHDSIGHLGIFVSGSVGRKEHREFAFNIDTIDLLPAGIYRAEIGDYPEDGAPPPEEDAYLMRIRHSSVDEVRAIVRRDEPSERRFATAARVSSINLAMYRNTLQPWVRALSSAESARWLKAVHPLRIGYEWWSDRHPFSGQIAAQARQAREQRQPVAPDNPFWQWQHAFSDGVAQSLDAWRDLRDGMYRMAFDTIYGTPAIQALVGLPSWDTSPVRSYPGETSASRAFLAAQSAGLDSDLVQGSLPEAVVRSLCFVYGARSDADERQFRPAWELLRPYLVPRGMESSRMAAFRSLVRQQSRLLQRDSEAAIAALPILLRDVVPDVRRKSIAMVVAMTGQRERASAEEMSRLQRVRALFEDAAASAIVPAATS